MTSGPRVKWDGGEGWEEDDVDLLEAQEEATNNGKEG